MIFALFWHGWAKSDLSYSGLPNKRHMTFIFFSVKNPLMTVLLGAWRLFFWVVQSLYDDYCGYDDYFFCYIWEVNHLQSSYTTSSYSLLYFLHKYVLKNKVNETYYTLWEEKEVMDREDLGKKVNSPKAIPQGRRTYYNFE